MTQMSKRSPMSFLWGIFIVAILRQHLKQFRSIIKTKILFQSAPSTMKHLKAQHTTTAIYNNIKKTLLDIKLKLSCFIYRVK